MVDTPRTAAYLAASAFQDGQIAGSIVPQRVRDFVSSVPFWDDPANASGLGVQAIFRGAVWAHLVTGVTRGAGQSLGTRQATATALNLAISYAATNGLEFKIANGIYEFDNTGGIVVPPNLDNFRWYGSNGVFLQQFHSNAPILSVGSMTNTSTDTLFGYIIDGVTCQYGATQTGQTAAIGIRIGAGQVGYCAFRNMTVNNNTGFNSYTGFLTTAGSSYAGNLFACEFSNIKVQGAQQDLLNHGLTGEGNNWYNIFVSQGSGTPGAIAGTAVNMASPFFAGGADEVWTGLRIDFVKAGGAILNIASQSNITINALHIEEAAGPNEFIQLASCTNLVINGCHFLNTNNLAAAGGSASCGFFYLYDNEMITINGLTIDWGGTGFVDTNFAFIFHDQTATDNQPRIVVNGLAIYDADPNNAQMNRILLLDRTVTTWVPPNLISRYVFSSAVSRIEGAEWASVTTTRTIYGQFEHTDLIVPAVLPGTINITLEDIMKSGSTATFITRKGNTCHVRRQSGSVSGTCNIINGGPAGGTITANATANVDLYYAFDTASAANWAAYTP